MKLLAAILSLCLLGANDLDSMLRQIEEGTQRNLQETLDVNGRVRHLSKPKDVGIFGTPNFTVIAPPDGAFLAKRVCEAAEKYRTQITAELGIPAMKGKEVIHIHVDSDGKPGAVWLVCGPGRQWGGDHRIWLEGVTEDNWEHLLEHSMRKVFEGVAQGAPQTEPVPEPIEQPTFEGPTA